MAQWRFLLIACLASVVLFALLAQDSEEEAAQSKGEIEIDARELGPGYPHLYYMRDEYVEAFEEYMLESTK